MPSRLQRIIQSDFGLGIQPDLARHLIDQAAVYDIQNGLLDDDGSIYRRGGAAYKSNGGLGSVALRWVWDGHLTPGRRTLVASSGAFGVLADNDATINNIGGSGLARPYSAQEVEGTLHIGSPTTCWIYGGSLKTASYNTGTIATTIGSKTITGTGTTWTTNVDAGMMLSIGSSERVYVVASVDSNTQITLRDAYEAGTTASGKSYTLQPLYTITTADPYERAEVYGMAGNRFIRLDEDKLRWADLDLQNGVTRPHVWNATDFHDFPDGVRAIGHAAIGDTSLVFTTGGIYSVQGLAFDLVDDDGNPQHRVDLLNRDIVLWGQAGIAGWQTGVIVPARDGIYQIDPVGGISSLSHPIEDMYRGYIEAGYNPGQAAVYRETYLLPILDSSNGTVDVLACRLDRPVRVRGTVGYPWTRLNQYGARVAAYTVRQPQSGSPVLLGTANDSSARLLNCSPYFTPGAAYTEDADGTEHVFSVITRDYETGALNRNRVRRVRLTYELLAAEEPKELLVYGHSMADDYEGGLARELAHHLGATQINHSVSGSALVLDDIADPGEAWSTNPPGGGWQTIYATYDQDNPPDVVLLFHGINDIAMCGAAGLDSTFEPVLRAALSYMRAREEVFRHTDPSVTVSPEWTTAGGCFTSDPDATITINVPADFEGGAISLSFPSTAGVPATSADGAEWVAHEGVTELGRCSTYGVGVQEEYAVTVLRIDGLAPGAHTIEVTADSMVGTVHFNHWLIEDPTPPLILLPLTNTAAEEGYDLYVDGPPASHFPHRPTNALVAQQVAIMEAVAAEFTDGRVLAVPMEDLVGYTVHGDEFLYEDGLHLGFNGSRLVAVRAYEYLAEAIGWTEPTIALDWATVGSTVTGSLWGLFLWGSGTWGASEEAGWTAAPGDAPPDDGDDPHTWHINRRVRNIRFRFRSSGPSARLVIRHLEIFVGPSGHVRR